MITAFADNGIDLEIYVWVADPEEGRANLRSDIYYTVWREFRARGIEIPYPQREMRMLGDGATTASPGRASLFAGRRQALNLRNMRLQF